MGKLLTPRHAQTDERLRLSVDPADYAKVGRGGKWDALVTDLNTGVAYRLWGAECSLPHCFCDAMCIEAGEAR